MNQAEKVKITKEFDHFCSCINFKKAFLDCRAIKFMNEFEKYLGDGQ